MLLSSPDSLVVSISREDLDTDKDDKGEVIPLPSTRKTRVNNFGIDCLESLKFTYKVQRNTFSLPFQLQHILHITCASLYVFKDLNYFLFKRCHGRLSLLPTARPLRSITRYPFLVQLLLGNSLLFCVLIIQMKTGDGIFVEGQASKICAR